MWIRTINGIVFIEVEQTEQGIYMPKKLKAENVE
jgi:hypothetical protein